MSQSTENHSRFQRWWIYQRERFPLAAHSPLVAAMSFGALGYAAAVGDSALNLLALVFCWLGLLGFFFLLRVADEFKDYDTDCRHRPYRPVPRGLISLRELALAAAGVVVLQVLLALWLDPGILLPLTMAWLWLALMTREFFAPAWLEARPLLYLVSHMLIMPLLMLYALAHSGVWQPDMWWLLAIAFGVGLCIEIGRKLRRPEDEEPGVDTYSKVWGRAVSSSAWLAAVSVTLVLMALAARQLGAGFWVWLPVLLLVCGSGLTLLFYLRHPNGPAAKFFEGLSASTTLVVYLLLGALPWAIH